MQPIACGEAATACGRTYRCDCETCSEFPDYASRMQRERAVVVQGPNDEGTIGFTISYEDGRCRGVASPNSGADGSCHVIAQDESDVGGCHRSSDDPNAGRLSCGEAVTVCDGLAVRCACPADGGRPTVTAAD